MNILVTGGCGFIGSHLVDELVEKKHNVIFVDDCSANNDIFYFNKKAKYFKIDICNSKKLNKIKNIDFCFHLGAESRLQQAIQNPKRAIDVNIIGTYNILEYCKNNNVRGLVFSSTSSIYGLNNNLPLKETENENCLNPYASTKYAAELLIKNYNTLFNVKSTILRYFNVFGERAPSAGQYALVTSIFLRQKMNKESLSIVGTGDQKRDFIYVKDIVSANIVCMESWDDITKEDLHKANIYNISSSTEISIKDLANIISSNQINIPERCGEVFSNIGDNSKFRLLTSWEPKTNKIDWLKNIL